MTSRKFLINFDTPLPPPPIVTVFKYKQFSTVVTKPLTPPPSDVRDVIYEWPFSHKIVCAAYIYFQFVFIIFWRKDIVKNDVRKMLVKLTPLERRWRIKTRKKRQKWKGDCVGEKSASESSWRRRIPESLGRRSEIGQRSSETQKKGLMLSGNITLSSVLLMSNIYIIMNNLNTMAHVYSCLRLVTSSLFKTCS